MDSLYPSNDRKQEFINPLDPSKKTVRLLTTTAEWVLRPSTYDRLEITLLTDDDAGNSVDLDFTRGHLPEEYDPIAIRMVDDTNRNLAHDIYQ
jgi:hypothetical protein